MVLTVASSDEGKLTEPSLVLSASSVNTYLRCGRQWEMAYVLGIKQPPTLRQTIGIAGHKAVELNMRQKIESRADLPVEQVLDEFATAYDEMTPEVELTPKEIEDGVTLGGGKDSGIAAVEAYHTQAAPLIQPIEVEKSIQFEINGIPYSGQIDTLDDALAVRDTKFVARTPQEGTYDLNMTGYALGVRQGASTTEGAVTESDVVLDVIVRNKTPKYVQVANGGPVDDERIRRFAGIVTDVYENIMAGNFTPNGVVGAPPACTWCGFKTMCSSYLGRR